MTELAAKHRTAGSTESKRNDNTFALALRQCTAIGSCTVKYQQFINCDQQTDDTLVYQ